MVEGNIIAFDFGTKRIGVAVGQALTQTATPLPLSQPKTASLIGKHYKNSLKNGNRKRSLWVCL